MGLESIRPYTVPFFCDRESNTKTGTQRHTEIQ